MTTIGVVTTAWGVYGRYLPEWVAAVASQNRRPDLVTVVDAGVDDIGPTREALAGSGLDYQVVTIDYAGMGHARNAAVDATPTEWVAHVDADDLLLSHALTDAMELSGRSDVVVLGALRGDEQVLFGGVSARRVLRGGLCSFSASPYRRALWEKRPYLTRNDWVDSALWVGFAHLGARFVATDRPGFVYRQHPDSHSHTLPVRDKRAAAAQLRRLCRRWTT